MNAPLHFEFVDDAAGFDAPGATLAARVPAGVRSKRELLSLLARQLQFPGYFGQNWDALFDCLGELIGPIAILHEGLPLRTAAQRRAYLEVLRDSPSVRAVFPSTCRQQVISLLTSDP